jgi:post-segregation antitoxin (ccd killing protein)
LRTSLYLPDDLAAKVRELDISISAVAQTALRDEVERLTTIQEIQAEGMENIMIGVGVDDEGQVGFIGRWLVHPDPAESWSTRSSSDSGAYYGVALTRRGRIAIYAVTRVDQRWAATLRDFDDLNAAEAGGLPIDITHRASKELGKQRVTWLDI